MKKLLFTFSLLIFIVSFGQDEKPFFLNYTSQDVIKMFNKTKAEADPLAKFKTNLSKNSFQWSLDFGNSTVYPKVFTYGFNDNGNITFTELYERAGGYNGKSINQTYNDYSLKYRQYDNNPKKSNKILKFKGINLEDSVEFRLNQFEQNVTVIISKYIVPIYNRRGTKILSYRGGVLVSTFPDKPSTPTKVNTNFYGWDLRDDEMIYNIKNYLTSFLFHITSPDTWMANIFLDELRKDPKNAEKIHNNWILNSNDKHFFNKFFPTHQLNCEFEQGQTLKYGHPNDKNKNNQPICSSDFISNEMKIEYQDLDGSTIAMAVGNVFDNGIMHVVIDPIKFKEASPSKRAFIMWHELFHTVGLDHGECGPLMFPYTNEDYTWEDWEAANGEAMKCFISKRNVLQEIY